MHARKILLAAMLATLALPSAAQYAPRWYAGLAGGQSRTSDDLVTNRESTVVNAVPSTIHSDFDSTGNAWKAFGGLRFNDWAAIEINYADLGRHQLTTSFVGGDPALPGSVSMTRKISGYGVDAVLSWPFAPGFAVFGKVGAFRSHLEADASLDGSVVFTNAPGDRQRSVTQEETVAKFGVGGDWWFRPNAALRLEWERYSKVGKAFAIGGSGTTGEADTDTVTLGLMMRF